MPHLSVVTITAREQFQKRNITIPVKQTLHVSRSLPRVPTRCKGLSLCLFFRLLGVTTYAHICCIFCQDIAAAHRQLPLRSNAGAWDSQTFRVSRVVTHFFFACVANIVSCRLLPFTCLFFFFVFFKRSCVVPWCLDLPAVTCLWHFDPLSDVRGYQSTAPYFNIRLISYLFL